MNKQELIAKIIEKTNTNLSKKTVEEFVNAFIDSVKESVAQGESVQLIGFGTFDARERASRYARNPKTGKEIVIPAKKVPAFKPGKAFKDAVNK